MRLILARLLYAFDVGWGASPKVHNWGEQQTFVFWWKDPLFIRLKRRGARQIASSDTVGGGLYQHHEPVGVARHGSLQQILALSKVMMKQGST